MLSESNRVPRIGYSSRLRLAVANHFGFALSTGLLLLVAQQADSAEPVLDTSTTGKIVTASADKPATSHDGVTVLGARNELQTLKDVPKSISVVTGDELNKTAALNVTDILKRIGNVKWNYGNPKTGSLSIRGVSAGSSEAIDPSLGVNVDGVAYAYVALASGADYIDVDTIDVTRGPQGSAGGKNTSMGTINIRTKQPGFTPEAYGSVTFGTQNSLITQAAVGGPVIDDLLAWRGTFYRNQQEGYYKNKYPDIEGRTSYENTDRSYGRIQFLLTPSADFSARLSADFKPKGVEFVNGLTFRSPTPLTYANGAPTNLSTDPSTRLGRRYFTSANDYTYEDYLNDPVNEDQNKGIMNGSKGASLELNWNVGNYRLTSISAYKDNYFQASNDEGTPFDITKNSGLYVHYEQLSQELRSVYSFGSVADVQGGFFFIRTQADANSRSRYGSDAAAWFATPAQYTALDVTGAAFGSGRALLKDSLDRVRATQTTYTENESAAFFQQTDWHISEPLTLTAGLRLSAEDRRTSSNKLVADTGFGAALNPANAGGFTSAATLAALQAVNNAAQLTLADQVASQYFGVATTTTPGQAFSSLSAAQRAQVTNAQAIRAAQAFNALYGTTRAEPYKDTLRTGNVSLSYELNNDTTAYVSWQHGAKAGISQISGASNGVGISRPVDAESSNAYEIGVKTSLFNDSLYINADVFLDNLKNFQQAVYFLDPVATANTGITTYISGTGNVPLVQVKGVELDASYHGIEHVTLRFAGAYNDARYKDSVFLARPVEDGNLSPAYFDAKGRTLPNAPKFSGNLSVDYRVAVFGNKEFHTSVNYNYTSRANSNASLSEYSFVDAYGLTDFSIGLGRDDGLFDVNFLVKNLFATDYRYSQTWNSYIPSTPRWFGISVSAKL